MNRLNKYFSLMVLVGLLALRLASTPTANISYLFLAAFALLGRTQAIQALTLSWLFSMLSPGLAAETTYASIGRYVVTFGAALSIFLRSGLLSGTLRMSVPVVATIALGTVLVVHSMLISPMPDVSILKAISWAVVMVTLISAWQGLSVDERERLASQLLIGLVLIMLLSLPLLVLPLGYLRNGTGFQGILNQPQAFGPTMALLGAWSASRLFAEKKPSWSSIALAGAALVMVILSEARTAGLALVLGVTVSIICASYLSRKPLRVIMPGLRSQRVWVVFGVALFLALAFAPRLSSVFEDYISKSGRAGQVQNILEAYDRSRGGLIDEMWENIKQHPFTGIGFGIASNSYEMEVERDPLFGLPVSASIEKGVLPLAILEELGIVFAIIVALWFWMVLRRSAKAGVTPLAVTTTALLLNLGENIFFSPGGLGLLLLVLTSWAMSPIQVRSKRHSPHHQQVSLRLRKAI